MDNRPGELNYGRNLKIFLTYEDDEQCITISVGDRDWEFNWDRLKSIDDEPSHFELTHMPMHSLKMLRDFLDYACRSS